MDGAFQLLRAAFKCMVLMRLQFGNAGLVDVKAYSFTPFSKFNGQRESDVSKADDGNGFVVFCHLIKNVSDLVRDTFRIAKFLFHL